MEPTFEPREHRSSTGPMVGIIIILLLMIAGACYFWSVRNQREDATLPYIPPSSTSTTTSR